MTSLTDERLTSLENLTSDLDLQTQKINSLIAVNKTKTDALINDISNNAASYAGNYMNIDDINGYRNKLVKRNNDGDFAANVAALNGLLLKGVQDSTAWGGDSGKLLAHVNAAGDISKTQVKDRHVASDANIQGSKLADNSIALAKLANADVSSSASANTLVKRDANGDILSQTAASSDNSTKVATTAFVQTAVNGLIASAPAELNTLKEIADRIVGDASLVTQLSQHIDASFALKTDLDAKVDSTYLDASFATKVSLADLSGNLDDVVQHLDASYALKESVKFSSTFNGQSDSTGIQGQIRFSNTYAYFCTASAYVDNTDPVNPVAVAAVWKQVALNAIV